MNHMQQQRDRAATLSKDQTAESLPVFRDPYFSDGKREQSNKLLGLLPKAKNQAALH